MMISLYEKSWLHWNNQTGISIINSTPETCMKHVLALSEVDQVYKFTVDLDNMKTGYRFKVGIKERWQPSQGKQQPPISSVEGQIAPYTPDGQKTIVMMRAISPVSLLVFILPLIVLAGWCLFIVAMDRNHIPATIAAHSAFGLLYIVITLGFKERAQKKAIDIMQEYFSHVTPHKTPSR